MSKILRRADESGAWLLGHLDSGLGYYLFCMAIIGGSIAGLAYGCGAWK